MEFNPPMEARSDKELFNIISNDEKWSSAAQEVAYTQLLSRRYSDVEIQKKKLVLKNIIFKYKERREKQRVLNKSESYSVKEMCWIVLSFPIKLIFPSNLLKPYYYLDQYNYKKKIIQRIGLTIISIAFWGLILFLSFK